MKNLNLTYLRHNRGKKASSLRASHISYNELTLVLSGTLEYYRNEKPISLSEGDAIYLPAGSLRARRESEGNADFISFNFTCEDTLDLPEKLSGCLNSSVSMLISLFDELSNHSYHDNKEKTEHLLACLLLILKDKHKTQNFNPLTLRIIKYLHENLSKRITLEDIGRLTFFSPVYCDTVFRKEVGRSIIDYHLQVRISEAKKLLMDLSLPLSVVAQQVGFDNYNYFSRVFRKRTGYSPTTYRQMIQYGI